MLGKCLHINYTHFWTVTKNDLSSLNNPFMEKFLLNKMSTYVNPLNTKLSCWNFNLVNADQFSRE